MIRGRRVAPTVCRAGARRFVAAATLAALGCASPEKKAAEQLKTAESWTQTSALTAQHWLDGAVPTVYAEQLLQAAKQTMDKSEQTLATSRLRADERADLAAAVRQRADAVELMRSGVQAGDRGAVATQLRRLTGFGGSLAALAQRMSGS